MTSNPFNDFEIGMNIHPRTAWIYQMADPVRGGVVWAGRTVGAMDGAIEPPWMGLRRVLPTHTAPPSAQHLRRRLLLRLLPLRLRVQGAALPKPQPEQPVLREVSSFR